MKNEEVMSEQPFDSEELGFSLSKLELSDSEQQGVPHGRKRLQAALDRLGRLGAGASKDQW